MDKPGIGSETFSIKFDESWLDRELITPRDFKVNNGSTIERLTKEEIISRYGYTEEQLNFLMK